MKKIVPMHLLLLKRKTVLHQPVYIYMDLWFLLRRLAVMLRTASFDSAWSIPKLHTQDRSDRSWLNVLEMAKTNQRKKQLTQRIIFVHKKIHFHVQTTDLCYIYITCHHLLNGNTGIQSRRFLDFTVD